MYANGEKNKLIVRFPVPEKQKPWIVKFAEYEPVIYSLVNEPHPDPFRGDAKFKDIVFNDVDGLVILNSKFMF